MYIIVIALLMLILPAVSTVIEVMVGAGSAPFFETIGKWFVFWGIGIRLLMAGIRQVVKPGLTSESILGIKGDKPFQIVRELGFANIGIGLVGTLSLFVGGFSLAAALAGGLFLILAGIEHAIKPTRNLQENIAMVSDLFVGLIAIIFFIVVIFS